MSKNRNFYRIYSGFTILELTIVFSVITILTSIFLANYRGGEKEFSLLRSANKVAQDLRTAQEMAMAGERFSDAFPKGGYGINFTNNSTFYILFADCDDDKEYDGSGGALSCAAAIPSNPYPEKIKDLPLESKIKISNLSFDTTPTPSLNITFFPPDPTITMSPSANSAKITLSYGGTSQRAIVINKVGLIEVIK